MKLKILAIITIILTISSVSVNASETLSSSIKEASQNTAFIDSQWQQLNEDGFGSIYNRGPRGIAIFNDKLVVGTANYNQEIKLTFNKTYSVRSFLYELIMHSDVNGMYDNMKSDGCEIWSYDGQNLQQLVGLNGYVPSGFGDKNNTEVGVLIEFKNYLYAGIRNHVKGCEIWRTSDLQNWELVLDRGNGNRLNGGVWDAAILNDVLYVGTINFGNGCEIFSTKTGNLNDWDVVVGEKAKTGSGFGTKSNFYVWSMCAYDNWLYVGTDNLKGGGELWKTKDGENWKPVLAYRGWINAKLHGADYPRGFDGGFLNYRGGIRNMVVYNDELYCGFCGEDVRFTFRLSKIKLFTIRQQCPFIKLRFLHYLDSPGLEIWKYNSSKDKWTRVVGGIRKGNFSGGFGDIKNEYPWSMDVYDGYLYVGTLREEPINTVISINKEDLKKGFIGITIETPYGGAQIWRFDGKEWMKINEDGFGDLYNVGIREMKVYDNSLIACTMNLETGFEMWKYNIPSE